MTTPPRRRSDPEQRVRPHTGMSVVCQDGLLGYVERSLPTWQPEHPTHVVVRTGKHSDQSRYRVGALGSVRYACRGHAERAQTTRRTPSAVPNTLTTCPTFSSSVQTRNQR